jgi:UDPglucose 6-dehydrogenase
MKYIDLNLLFNPEYLTERNAKFDFINQSRFIIGSGEATISKMYSENLADLFRDRFGESTSILETNYETAEMIKYMNNCFFVTKVSFMNEMYKVAEKSNVDWKQAVSGFVTDGRIGHTHLDVPGPDGKFGFGGSCFPKDVRAMIKHADGIGVDVNVLKAAWETNLQVRPEKDWEQLKGRSVVDG